MRKVRIVNTTGVSQGGTEVIDIESGIPLTGMLEEVHVSIKTLDPVKAHLHLAMTEVEVDVAEAQAVFYCNNPRTGVLTPLKSITFEDGTTVEL